MDEGAAAAGAVVMGAASVVVAGTVVVDDDSPSSLHDPAANATASNVAAIVGIGALCMGFPPTGSILDRRSVNR
jgi:hypothetical protein